MIVKLNYASEQDLSQPSQRLQRRVLHIINGEHYSGAERVQDLLALRLPDYGYDVGFVTLKSGIFSQQRRSQDAPLHQLAMRSRWNPWIYREVVERFREGNYHLLHAHTPRSLMIAALAARAVGCPLVYHVHSPVGRDSQRWWANRLNTWVETWALKRVDRLICVSASLRKYMRGLGHPEEKLRVILNGVPVSSLPPRPPSSGPLTVGMVALFRPRKGIEILLQALARLRQRGQAVQMLAVGPFETTEYQREVQALVASLGIADLIHWTGFDSNVMSRLQEMDAMVLPSLFGEGLPMVVLEAMAAGVPVVASEVEGIPEAIRHGIDGMLVPPNNPEELANTLSQLAVDPRRRQELGVAGRNRHRDFLSDVSMAEKLSRVYDEL